MRRPSVTRPIVFYKGGYWWRSAAPSLYDCWLVLNDLHDWQRKLAAFYA